MIRSLMRARIAVVALLLSVSVAQVARAHGGKPTIAEIRFDDNGVHVQLMLFDQDLQKVHPGYAALDGPDLEAANQAWSALQDYLTQHFQIRVLGRPCLLQWQPRGHLDDGRRVVEGRSNCRLTGQVEIRSTLFLEVDTQHRTLAVVRRGDEPQAWTLSARVPQILVPLHSSVVDLLKRFVAEGVAHILGGADHLLFVIGLLLLAGALNRRLLLAVTGFTIAHTTTLALAAFGRVQVPLSIVEPIVGASIAYLGFEVVWRQARFSRVGLLVMAVAHLGLLSAVAAGALRFPIWTLLGLTWFVIGYGQWLRTVPDEGHVMRFAWLPFVFGLAHGLGFAGPLLELQLPDRDMVVALLAFNMGVEVGQLGVIAVSVLLASAVLRLRPLAPVWRDRIVAALCTVLIVAGTWWFVGRTLP
ncbi:MAG: hypothetical protein D6761_10900 [Candidatus Dadabacteria bacterium]|nr:MAG: hypothetical protein D6761_10900 [Candidatus Dadabacteria bacterium]